MSKPTRTVGYKRLGWPPEPGSAPAASSGLLCDLSRFFSSTVPSMCRGCLTGGGPRTWVMKSAHSPSGISATRLAKSTMRCSELCRAKVGDVITVEGRTALSVTVKGRGRRVRRRHIPLSTPVATALYEYLLSRGIESPQHPDSLEQPLLLNSQGRAWERTGLSGLMARIGREAQVSRFRVSAHKLRHTASVVSRLARLADGSKLDRWTRSQLLSHQNPASLDRYEHLLPDELFEALEAQRRGLARYLGVPEGP